MKHIVTYKLFETETTTMVFWHGGNLENHIQVRTGKWEYGPGLYLTTNYDTAKNFAKGSRKLYMITVERGVDIRDVSISTDEIRKFVKSYIIGAKRKEFLISVERHNKNGVIKAEIFLNIIINNDAVKNTNTEDLKNFFVNNGIDYLIVDNAYGWGEKMMVLFNMDKIKNKVIIKPSDKIETYELPTEFS